MANDQVPYIEKLKKFADEQKLKTRMTTYGNQTNDTGLPAPVIHIETTSSIEETARVGAQIQREVFRNNSDTLYDIVP